MSSISGTAHYPFSSPLSASPVRNPQEIIIAWLSEVFDLTAASSNDNLKAVHLRADTAPRIEGNEQLEEIIQIARVVSLDKMQELHLLIEDLLKSLELDSSRISESF